MKTDHGFIERLNLYIDRELDPRAAAAFEAEVRADPGKARVLAQYRRMEKASQVLFEGLRDQAGAPRMAGPVLWVPHPLRRPSSPAWVRVAWGGGALAAACALVFVAPLVLRESGASAPTAEPSLAVASPASRPVAVTVSAPAASTEAWSRRSFEILPASWPASSPRQDSWGSVSQGLALNTRQAVAASFDGAGPWKRRVTWEVVPTLSRSVPGSWEIPTYEGLAPQGTTVLPIWLQQAAEQQPQQSTIPVVPVNFVGGR